MKVGAVLGVLVMCSAFASCSKTPDKPPESPSAEAPASAPAAAPVYGMLSVTPSSGSGRQQMFTVKLARAGAALPPMLGLLVTAGSGSNACYAFRVVGSKHLLLVNDSGSGSKHLQNVRSISNSQCEITDAGTSEAGPKEVTAQLEMKFRPAFVGPKKLYAIAQDDAGNSSGLHAVGEYTVQ